MDYTNGLFNIFLHIELSLFKKAAFMENINTNLQQLHEIPDTGITRKQLKTQLVENALFETRNNFNVYHYKVGDIYRKTWYTYRKLDSARRTEYKIYNLTPEQIDIFLENFNPSRPHEIYLNEDPELIVNPGYSFKVDSYYKPWKVFMTTYKGCPISIPICDVEYIKLLDEKKILKITTKPIHKQWVSYNVLEQYMYKSLLNGDGPNITIPYLGTEKQVLDYDFLGRQVEIDDGVWVYLNKVEWVKFTTENSVKILKLEDNNQ